jgi:hypothetical protein
MMKWTIFLTIIILATSCRIERKIFSSVPVNNPSLQKKKDFSVNATISAPKGFDLNGGFALTNRLAVIAGAYSHKNKETEIAGQITPSGIHDDSSKLVYRHNGITIGTGAYFPLSKRKSSAYLSFFAGMSTGSFRMNEEMYENQVNSPGPPVFHSYKSRLNRYFLQTSLNFYDKNVEVSFTSRYSLVGYKKINTDYTNGQLSSYRLPPFTTPELNSFLDLAFDLKVLFSQNTRWGMQLFGVITGRLDNDEYGIAQYDYYPIRIGTGIFFRGFR